MSTGCYPSLYTLQSCRSMIPEPLTLIVSLHIMDLDDGPVELEESTLNEPLLSLLTWWKMERGAHGMHSVKALP